MHAPPPACYVMLCRKMNLKASETFEDTIGSIASDLFMAYRDAQRLWDLSKLPGCSKSKERKFLALKRMLPPSTQSLDLLT